MRFSSLAMVGTTHLRCTDVIIAALLAHPNYQSNKTVIHEAKRFVLGHRAKWAYAFHLPKREAHEVLSECLPEITRRQLSTGMWKRKYAEVYTYGLLRALKHAELLEQDTFRYDLYQNFREKTDLISSLVRKNIMHDSILDVANVAAEPLSTQQENGSWFNSLSATCFQLQILNELGVDASHESVSLAIKWIFAQFHETFEKWNINFEKIFLTDNYVAECNGLAKVAPEHGHQPCIGSIGSGHNPATTTALALYTLTKLGYENDQRIVDSYESIYNLRGIRAINGEINDMPDWCASWYHQKSVRFDVKRTGVTFDDYLQALKERRAKQRKKKTEKNT